MRAVSVDRSDRPPTVVDLPRPAPSAREVLVRIEAPGLCRTDIHALEDVLARRVSARVVFEFATPAG